MMSLWKQWHLLMSKVTCFGGGWINPVINPLWASWLREFEKDEAKAM